MSSAIATPPVNASTVKPPSPAVAPPSRCRVLAETIAKMAVRILLPLATAIILYSVLPLTFLAGVVIIGATIGMAFASAQLFTPKTLPQQQEPPPRTIDPSVQQSQIRTNVQLVAVAKEKAEKKAQDAEKTAVMKAMTVTPPRGLSNESAVNCWVNSLAQLLRCDSLMMSWIGSDKGLQSFRDFYKTYGAPDKKFNSQTLRKTLHEMAKDLIQETGRQESAAEGFLVLSRMLSETNLCPAVIFTHNCYSVADHPPLDRQQENPDPDYGYLSLEVKKGTHPSLNDLLANYFHSKEELDAENTFLYEGVRYTSREVTRKYDKAPPSLWIELKGTNGREKSLEPVQIPDQLPLTVIEEGPANYQLDGFIVHVGETHHKGHYFAFKREGGKWHKINDSIVTDANQAEIEAILGRKDLDPKLGQVTLIHYSKA